MKNESGKKAGVEKGNLKKLDIPSLKKIKGGQTPMRRSTIVKGKGAIS
ncbi:MAG TPA: hypothetical protein PLU53_15290 [Bacteroidia bacterium]|nr:hypothetical protein [Bacteroidia bacterium]